MLGRKVSRLFSVALVAAAALGAGVSASRADPERLFSYPIGIGQTGPRGSLARAADGTLYAATYGLGPSSRGGVFAYTPPTTSGGSWGVVLIHGFSSTGEGGRYPQAGVTLGPAGELYGTTVQGGINDRPVVFRLTPPAVAGGAWTKDIIHQFAFSDGFYPSTNLLLGADGSLFGTTEGGGPSNCGIAFRLTPKPSGALPWKFKVLEKFSQASGCTPRSKLLSDASGNLYGTLFTGGPDNIGSVYRLALQGDGTYKFSKLKVFRGATGLANPMGDIVFDSTGALIGAARNGGGKDCGGVYRLTPPLAGSDVWGFNPVRSFAGNPSGCFPVGVARDPATGDLAVSTYQGGPFNAGALLRLIPRAAVGQYDVRTREYFGPSYNYPQGSPILDPDGAAYGSTTDAISIWRSAP